MKKTVEELAQLIEGTVQGDGALTISAVTKSDAPKPEAITFMQDAKQLAALEASTISCIIATPDITSALKTIITTPYPKLCFALIAQLFHPSRQFAGTISERASIHPTARIAAGVTIEDFVVIGKNVTIGKGSTIRSCAVIDENVQIGEETLIHPQVTIYDNMIIGNRVIIHASTVIGSDGFGYVRNAEGAHVKIPQIGNIIIEDDVEIGSNVSIDRATFGSTIIKKDVKIDNLVQIAHNVSIGEHTAISGQTGIAGSSILGKQCTIAAQVGIADHCKIEDKVMIGGQSGITNNKRIPEGQIFLGSPARPIRNFMRQQGYIAKLSHIFNDVKELKKRLAELETTPPPSNT